MAQRKLNEEIIHSIIESLTDLLKEKPFEDITIVEIITHAGVSRNSFYRNFTSKEDILVRHIKDTTEDLVESNRIPILQVSWEVYVQGMLEHLYSHREFLDLLEKNGKLHLISDIVDETIRKRTEGKLDSYHQAFLAGGLFNIYKQWAHNGYTPSPAEIAKTFRSPVLGF